MKVAIGDLGGIDQVIAIMKKFFDNEKMQLIGCGTACNLVHKNKENAEKFVRHNGIPAILAAMKAFPDNAKLQWWACCTFKALLRKGEWKAQVKKSGAVPVVAAALATHNDNVEVCSEAGRLMKLLL